MIFQTPSSPLMAGTFKYELLAMIINVSAKHSVGESRMTNSLSLSGRICSESGRERRYSYRYQMQRWSGSSRGENHLQQTAETGRQQEDSYC